jgi:hypothetical protein
MVAFARAALFGAALLLLTSVSAAADYGRTSGSFVVSPTGAANFTIPIWTPPGPNGLQPSIGLAYNSQGGNGLGGVGWNVSGLGAITRCPNTMHQDGFYSVVNLTTSDRLCINGNRMRLASGIYHSVGSVYYTELADYSRITAYSQASGGIYFVVETKDGLKYEYGNSTASRTPTAWMLTKVSDRAGNNYVVTYFTNGAGFAFPLAISWTPVNYGASTYRYQMQFGYASARTDADSQFFFINGVTMLTRHRLETISITSNGVTKRKYIFSYLPSPSTGRSV